MLMCITHSVPPNIAVSGGMGSFTCVTSRWRNAVSWPGSEPCTQMIYTLFMPVLFICTLCLCPVIYLYTVFMPLLFICTLFMPMLFICTLCLCPCYLFVHCVYARYLFVHCVYARVIYSYTVFMPVLFISGCHREASSHQSKNCIIISICVNYILR